MLAEGTTLKECTGGNHARGECQHEDTRSEGILNDAENMIAPGDKDEECVDDPNAIFFQEFGNWTIITYPFLHQVVDRGKWTDRAPKPTKEQKDDRYERPPKDPCQCGTEIVMRGLG